MDHIETDVREALLSLARSPASLDDAFAEYRREAAPAKTESSLRAELAALDTALSALTAQEAAAVQAQIAGIIAGASPAAYAAAFADIAARRKDLEDRRGTLSHQLRNPVASPAKSTQPRAALEAQALEDAALVLSAPDIPGTVKRDIISRVLTRVECGKTETGEETRVFVPKEFTQEVDAETVTETRNIVLIGFMGTGKSAVGRALARRTGWRHLDTDAEIERAAGKTIPQIFAEDGEEVFRAQETVLLKSLEQSEDLILSTGGGTPLRAENAVLLKRIGTVVWLHVAPEAILARVAHSLPERPLLAAYQADPLGRIQSLLAQREPLYAALADVVLETSDCANSEEGAARLMERLG